MLAIRPPTRSPSPHRRVAPPSGQCSASAPTMRMPPLRAMPCSRRAARAHAPPPPALLPRSPRRTACALRPGEGRTPRRRGRQGRRGRQKGRRRALRGGRPLQRRHRVRWRVLSSRGGHFARPEASRPWHPEVTWSRRRGTLLALTSCTELTCPQTTLLFGDVKY